MKKLLAELDRQIEKARKDFFKSSKIMDALQEIPLKELTEKQKNVFHEASETYNKSGHALTALHTAKKAIENIQP